MEPASKPASLRLEADEDSYVKEELEKLEDLEQSVLDYALQNPAASSIHDKPAQDRIALSGADIEFRKLCPGENKETLLNIINHRRRAQDRFELDDESVGALDTILASNVISELTCLAKDPLRYQLDDSIWISPTPAKDTHMYAKLYIRELRLPVSSLTAYMPAYQNERPRDIPWLTAITNEISEAGKMTSIYMRYAGYTADNSQKRHTSDMKQNVTRYSRFINGFQNAFHLDDGVIIVREMPLLRALNTKVAEDFKIASMLENLLVDVLGLTALNCAVGGLAHDIIASPTTLSAVSDWELPALEEICQPEVIANCWNNFFRQLGELPEELIGPLPSARTMEICTRQSSSYLTTQGLLMRLVVGKDITQQALKESLAYYDDSTGRGPDLFKKVLSLVYSVSATMTWCEAYAPYIDLYPCTIRHPRWIHACQLQKMLCALNPLIITPHSREVLQLLANGCLLTAQTINDRADFIEYVQEAEKSFPMPAYSGFDFKELIGKPVIISFGTSEEQFALVIPEYHPGNFKYDTMLQRARCQLMILAEKAVLVAQVMAFRMLDQYNGTNNRKQFIYELRERVLVALKDNGILEALEAARKDMEEVEQYVAQTCLNGMKEARKAEVVHKQLQVRMATNSSNPYSKAVGDAGSEERRAFCERIIADLRSRQERGTATIGFAIPCPTSMTAGGDEWVEWIMSRIKDKDLHASTRFFGKDPLASIEDPRERGEAMRKRMKHFGQIYEGNLTCSKEAHIAHIAKWIKDVASPDYLLATESKARPMVFMCTNCDWAIFDGSRSSTRRIHICPKDIQDFEFKEDEIPGAFNEQAKKPTSQLFKNENIVRCTVWFVHDLLCHPRAAQLLLPENLTDIGLRQVGANKFLATSQPSLVTSLQLPDIWIGSEVEENSPDYVNYLTTASMDVFLRFRPSSSSGTGLAAICDAFPDAFVDHRKMIDFGLKRVVSAINQRLAHVEESSCATGRCSTRVLEYNTKDRMRHQCHGKKVQLRPTTDVYKATNFEELPKAFQVCLWRAHRCMQFQYHIDLASMNPIDWNK